MNGREDIFSAIYDAVVGGDAEKTENLARKSIEAGIPPLETIEEALTPGIREVGEQFERMEKFLPEMVASAEAMEAATAVLEPHFEPRDRKKRGKILIGTVQGDIHDIGKNIVVALLTVNGYEVIDLGRNVPAVEFVDKAAESNVDVVGISGLMTTSMPMMRDVIELLEEDGVREEFIVLIGGGPTSQEYADQIGADGYGDTAYKAIKLCDRLLGYEADT